MIIWMVDTGIHDNSCTWSKREDAIRYLKEEAKDCGWTIKLERGEESNPHDFLNYRAFYNDSVFLVSIIPIFLDEKPYFYMM